jgi:hypothetical protein
VLGNDTFEGTEEITGTTNGTNGTVAVNNTVRLVIPPTISSSTRRRLISTAPTASPIR